MPNIIPEKNYFEELYQATEARNIAIIKKLLTQVHVDIKDPLIELTVAGKFAYEAKDASAQFLYQNFSASPNSIGEAYARSGNFLQARKWCIHYGAHPTYIAQGLAFRGDKRNYNKWYKKHQYLINVSLIREALILGKQNSEPYSTICQSVKTQKDCFFRILYCISQVASIEIIKSIASECINQDTCETQKLLVAIISGLMLKDRIQDVQYLKKSVGFSVNKSCSILLNLYITLKKGHLVQNERLLEQCKNHENFKKIKQCTVSFAMQCGYLAYAQRLHNSGDTPCAILIKAAWINPFQGLNMLYQKDQSTLLELLCHNYLCLSQIHCMLSKFWNLPAIKHSLIAIQAPNLRNAIINKLKFKAQKNQISLIISLNSVLSTITQLAYDFNQAELLALSFYPIEISTWVLIVGPVLCERNQLIPDALKYVTQCFSLFPSSETEFCPNKIHKFLFDLKENKNIGLSKKQKNILCDFFKIQPITLEPERNLHKRMRIE